MEVDILTGYTADNLNELQSQSSTVKRVESDSRKIVLYLDEVGISLAFIINLFSYEEYAKLKFDITIMLSQFC